MEVRQAGSLQGERVGVCPGVRARGGSGVLPTALVVASAGDMCSSLPLLQNSVFLPTPCFALSSSEVVGCFVLFCFVCLFVSSCHKFALTANAQSNF